jgi:hypothetical protein
MNRQSFFLMVCLGGAAMALPGWAAKAQPAVPEIALAEPEVPYGVAPTYWDGNLGSQRAIIRVKAPAAAVRVHLPWRLQMAGMQNRQIVVAGSDGKPLANVVRIAADRMSADLVFEATAGGDYAVYYLSMRPYGNMNDWSSYVPYQCQAAPAWLAAQHLNAEALPGQAWRQLPEATVVEFQARSELDRLDPMEVIAAEAETQAMLARHPQPLLLFPEDRRNTIRMQRDVPLSWAKSGPASAFAGEAQQHEYYAFQIGLYAPKQAANAVAVQFSPLISAAGAEIPATALTCFNLGGINAGGQPFTKPVNVPPGNIQALWFGADIAKNQKPGTYVGTITVQAEGIAPQAIAVRLTVKKGVIAERGDNEPWRHSRLRWLNSTAGTEDFIPEPYVPLRVNGGNTISCLGRTLTLGNDGLPATITCGTAPVLAAPARFVIAGQTLVPGPLQWGRKLDSRVSWTAHSTGAAGKLECAGEMEYDGHLRYQLTFTPAADITLPDMRLELPYRADAATYILGAGLDGGARQGNHLWKWQGPYNSFWLGSPEAGLHCKLLGGSYTGPMLALYHPAPPAAWHNGGQGGVAVTEDNGQVVATAFSGERQLKAGQPVVFEFSLLVTPVKPIDQKTHFATRYFHFSGVKLTSKGYEAMPTPEALAAGINVINIHHATPQNPYINYPYIAVPELKSAVDEMHARRIKVKLYDTVRELSSMTTELWALRSLGSEVLAGGGGGGGSWCQEHLLGGYAPQWFQRFGEAPPDAAVLVNGNVDSRWLNYYVEGIGWLIRNTGIDGLYLDDVSYDRHILQRVRTVMAQNKQGCLIDLHSNTAFSKGCANHYLEFLPFIDRPWFGESFNYNAMSPDQYLVQVSGIPFGLVGEMLHDGGNPWRGALYGMTNRLGWMTNGHLCDPRPVWKLWDRFGLAGARMAGYWKKGCPVKTGQPQVQATVYLKKGSAMIALASWAPQKVETRLAIDWQALGLDPAKAVLFAPKSLGFQKAQTWKPGDAIAIEPGRGWLIIVDEKGPVAADMANPDDKLPGRAVMLEEEFKKPLGADWTVVASKQPGTRVETTAAGLVITAGVNVTALVERALPARTTAVDCRLDGTGDPAYHWGPGISLVWANGTGIRLQRRQGDGCFGVTTTLNEDLVKAGRLAGTATLRLRLEADSVIAEARNEDELAWQQIASFPRDKFAGAPVKVRIGKMHGPLSNDDFSDPGGRISASVQCLRVYGSAH